MMSGQIVYIRKEDQWVWDYVRAESRKRKVAMSVVAVDLWKEALANRGIERDEITGGYISKAQKERKEQRERMREVNKASTLPAGSLSGKVASVGSKKAVEETESSRTLSPEDMEVLSALLKKLGLTITEEKTEQEPPVQHKSSRARR